MSSPLVVTGASGGLGSSTLAAALAGAWSKRAPLLVDLDLTGGGIDVTCGIDHVEGLRWPDLNAVRGVVDPDLLVRSLPASRGCAVLSAGASRVEPALGPPPKEAIVDVLETVARASTPLIVDLPRWQYWPPDLDLHTWILLTGTRTRELADLDALLHQIDGRRLSGGQAVVVTTGPEPDRALIEAIEDHVGLTHIGHVPRQPALVHAMERGRWPGSRPIAGLLDNLQRRGRPSAA